MGGINMSLLARSIRYTKTNAPLTGDQITHNEDFDFMSYNLEKEFLDQYKQQYEDEDDDDMYIQLKALFKDFDSKNFKYVPAPKSKFEQFKTIFRSDK
jgi:hypothetical protein